jgi:hypothetical protein
MIQSKTIFYEVQSENQQYVNRINVDAFLRGVAENDTEALPVYKKLDE